MGTFYGRARGVGLRGAMTIQGYWVDRIGDWSSSADGQAGQRRGLGRGGRRPDRKGSGDGEESEWLLGADGL